MRKVRPESRRWAAPPVLGSPFRQPIDPLLEAVPFVPLPDPKKSAWAILCPAGCTTELIIPPDYAGQWLECPTCGFRFLGPHPAQPRMIAEARARAARAAAEEEKMAGVLAALAKVEPQPEPPVAAQPQAKLGAKPPAPAKADELPLAELVSEQVQVMDTLELLAAASREAAKPPPALAPHRIVLKARPPAQQEAKAASALDELDKKCRQPGNQIPATLAPPRRASAPAEPAPGDLTPEETMALDALEALAEATIPARAAPAPAAASVPAAAVPVAKPVPVKKSPSRVAQRLDLGAAPRRKKIQPAKRPTRVVSPAPARGRHSDLVLTWVVSLVIAAAIVGTGVACQLYDLALLGGIVFVGLPVARTVKSLARRRDDGLPY
jgi:DNA-directed RNA polymerase subunit RPC12/RpoP